MAKTPHDAYYERIGREARHKLGRLVDDDAPETHKELRDQLACAIRKSNADDLASAIICAIDARQAHHELEETKEV